MLLEQVRARKITIIVVYKVDRLTRSLADFAKLVEIFDDHGISFVSVYAHCEPVSGVAEQKFRRFENTHQRLGPKTGLKTASTRPPKGAETLSGSASL